MKAPKTAAATPTTKLPAVILRPRALPVLTNGLEEEEPEEPVEPVEPVLVEPAAVVVAVLPDELPDPELEPPLVLPRESEVPQASL